MAEIVVLVPPHAFCEETVGGTFCRSCQQTVYVFCGAHAEVAVWHAKDRRVYYMCTACGSHNVQNRGGVDVTDLIRRV